MHSRDSDQRRTESAVHQIPGRRLPKSERADVEAFGQGMGTESTGADCESAPQSPASENHRSQFSEISQAPHRCDRLSWNRELLELLPDAESSGPLYVLVLRSTVFAVAVDIDIVEEDPLLGHLIAATDVDLITHGVDNDRDAVQLAFVLVEGTHSGSGRGGEVAVESRFQIRRYLLGAAALDSVARNEIDQL